MVNGSPHIIRTNVCAVGSMERNDWIVRDCLLAQSALYSAVVRSHHVRSSVNTVSMALLDSQSSGLQSAMLFYPMTKVANGYWPLPPLQ